MNVSQPQFSSLERTLQQALQRVEPPRPFVRGLGYKIRSLPRRSVANRVNSLVLLLLILAAAISAGVVSALLARLFRNKSSSPRP